jgi:hypothetical protein
MACSEKEFCVDSGGNLYDGQYTTDTSTYNGFTSYTGDSVPFFIYYSLTQDRWCLSTSLGGTCLQFGPVGIGSDCPDFDESFFITGICITTTTTTSPCDVFNFEAIFDCLVPTTTTTTTLAPTTTTTTTIPFDPCTGVSVNASITAYTTTTTTIPVTTTTTTEVIRPCNFDGIVTFNTFDEYMRCGNSKKFRDCLTGLEYFSNELVFNESGDTLIQNWVYKSTINGVSTCVTFAGLVDNISGSDLVVINETLGSELQGACLECVPDQTTTTTTTAAPTTTTTTTVGCQIIQYRVQNNGITVQEFKYFDCDGNTINCIVGTGINSTRTICSVSPPIVLPNSNVLVYPVTPQTFCNSVTIC